MCALKGGQAAEGAEEGLETKRTNDDGFFFSGLKLSLSGVVCLALARACARGATRARGSLRWMYSRSEEEEDETKKKR
jgi:hypothetical protein